MTQPAPVLHLTPTEEGFYDEVFQQVAQGQTTVGAGEAVVLLRKSGLPDTVLHAVWEHSDRENLGELDKEGFRIAMKLVALAQNGHEPVPENLALTTSLPVLGEEGQRALAALQTKVNWTISAEEKAKYDAVFVQLDPDSEGKISGRKAKQVLLNSRLPTMVLGKVWDLSDLDRDGKLDSDEFAIAMHLVYQCLEGKQLPDALPANLVPPKRARLSTAAPSSTSTAAAAATTSAPPANPSPNPPAATTAPVAASAQPAVRMASTAAPVPAPTTSSSLSNHTAAVASSPASHSPAPPVATSTPPPPPAAAATKEGMNGTGKKMSKGEWVVAKEEKKTYDGFFKDADKDHDGFVSGPEVMGIFLGSNLPKPTLAHIWNLVDLHRAGRLNAEQFALAMHLISRKVKGFEVPEALTEEMIPPSMRTSAVPDSASPAPVAATDDASTLQLRAQVEQAKAKRASVTASVEDTRQQIASLRVSHAALEEELAKEQASIREQEKELAEAERELEQLRTAENTLRQQLKDSKAQLVELLDKIKNTKTEQAKTQSSTARLVQSKQKVDESLKQYGTQFASPNPSTPAGRTASQKPEEMPDTHGMSFEDYFGATPAPATSKKPKAAVQDPFGMSPFGDPFKSAPPKKPGAGPF